MSKINETIFNIEQKWDIDLLFSITEKYNGVCLFTSVDDENYGKNIVGINPVLKINSIEQIDKLLELNRSDSDLPLMLGYVAYDFKDEIEEKGLYSDLHERIFPDIHFSVFEYYLIADNS
ncbi:MAG: hypothetical protein L6407_05895, partial [Candidatus Delongbacteria bacterium]|nr:hypothetical protein [Candidatus Delongbacteria bacterium]